MGKKLMEKFNSQIRKIVKTFNLYQYKLVIVMPHMHMDKDSRKSINYQKKKINDA